MSSTFPESAPGAPTGSYAEELQRLYSSQRYPFTRMLLADSITHTIGTGEQQQLPLMVTRDGSPMDVLFTVAVGSFVDDNGVPRPVGPPNKNGTFNAVTTAAKNYAAVRTPNSNMRAELIEMTPEELATGRCEYSSTPSNGPGGERFISPLPTDQEPPLALSIALGERHWPPKATIHLQMSPADKLFLDNSGSTDTYAMVAVRF